MSLYKTFLAHAQQLGFEDSIKPSPFLRYISSFKNPLGPNIPIVSTMELRNIPGLVDIVKKECKKIKLQAFPVTCHSIEKIVDPDWPGVKTLWAVHVKVNDFFIKLRNEKFFLPSFPFGNSFTFTVAVMYDLPKHIPNPYLGYSKYHLDAFPFVLSTFEKLERNCEFIHGCSVPMELIDPVHLSIMRKPILLFPSGRSVDESTYMKMKENNQNFDPLDRTPIANTVQNRALQECIDRFLDNHPVLKIMLDKECNLQKVL